MKQYKYDVAFSFLAIDEELVTRMYILLKDRIGCFIYSEQQKKLAGTDGESVFNDVFAKETRVVVVFYRDGWGKTNWTRIEETAIKNRGYDEGYDYVILIRLDKSAPPKWLPKNRIWIGLDRWGLESAASVIEARVQDLHGTVREFTVEERILRQSEIQAIRKKNKEIHDSSRGVILAKEAFEEFKSMFEKKMHVLKSGLADWHLHSINNNMGGQNVMSYNYSLNYSFLTPYFNTAKETGLRLTVWRGYFNENLIRTDHFFDYSQVFGGNYYIAIDDNGDKVWADQSNAGKFLTSSELVDLSLDTLFKNALKEKEEKYSH